MATFIEALRETPADFRREIPDPWKLSEKELRDLSVDPYRYPSMLAAWHYFLAFAGLGAQIELKCDEDSIREAREQSPEIWALCRPYPEPERAFPPFANHYAGVSPLEACAMNRCAKTWSGKPVTTRVMRNGMDAIVTSSSTGNQRPEKSKSGIFDSNET
ncbi:MAG: hypothetical protein ACRD4C_03945 [Candidatus Acidiferrales bacterium]